MDAILEALGAFRSANVFNPWRDTDDMDVWGSGPEARRQRLRAHFGCRPKIILVGEAPGYQGCHFSGVPFTNEKLILEGSIPRVSSTFRLTSRKRPWCEPSATIVWGQLREMSIAEHTVLWNAFAWHPHHPGDPYSNRRPTRTELEAGLPVLRAVLGHFTGVPVVPVGQVAGETLARLGVETHPLVRHPAYGGANEFRRGLQTLLA